MSSEIDYEEVLTVSREHLKDYAEASGDHNLIHLDDSVAKKAGLPGVIAHGMLVAGLVGVRIEALKEDGWRVTRFQTRFKAMTVPGEKILVGGRVKSESDEEKEWVLNARNPDGEVKVVAQITLKKIS